MTLTRTRSNGTTWSLTASTLQLVYWALGGLAIAVAALTPFIDYRAGSVASSHDVVLRAEITKTREETDRQSVVLTDLRTHELASLHDDLRDMRADIRSILETLSAKKDKP